MSPANCRIVKETEDISDVAKTLQESQSVTAFLRRFPQVGTVLRAINPAADLTKGDLAKHTIAHAVLREERQAAVTAALSLTVNKPLDGPFKIDDLGYTDLASKGSGKSSKVHMNDLIEGTTANKFKLTPEQADALKLRKDIWDDITFDYNRFGGKLNREEGLFPRLPVGRLDENGALRSKSDVEISTGGGGAKLKLRGGFTRARAMDAKGNIISADAMVKKGWRYSSIDDALAQRAHEVGRSTADFQYTDWLTKRSDVVKKGDVLGKGVETGLYPAAAPAEKFGGIPGETIDVLPFASEKTPALAGYYAPAELTKYVTDILARPEHADIPILSGLAAESRGAIASFDIGTTGIQLLGALGADIGHFARAVVTANPKAVSAIFPRAVAGSVQALFKPKYLSQYYATNKEVIDRWAPYIGGLHNSEYFTNLQKGSETGLGVVLKPVHTAEAPFARSFEAGLDIAKIEYIKALEKLHGENLTRVQKEQLGAWVRNSTGVLSSSRLGISSRQQAAESTFLFFSSRYTRSLFAAVGTALKTDMAGTEARIALGGLAFGGLALYAGVTHALDQPMRLDPKKPGFLSIRVGNNWVGIGGGTRALTRLMATSLDTAKNNPKAFLSPDTRGNDTNPLLAFWRSRSAPLTSLAIDLWNGEDFRGRPIEGVGDWARIVETRTLPFAIQAALESKGQLDTKSGMALLSGVGLNTNPMTARQVLDEYVKGVTDVSGEQRFPDGASTVNSSDNHYKEFLQADPYAQKLQEQYEQERLVGSHPGRDIQKILSQRHDRLLAADEMLDKTGDYYMYRNQISTIRADARKTLEDLNLDSIRSSGDRKTVSDWYKTYDDSRAVDQVTGGINSEGLDQAQAEWKLANPGEYERLIEPTEQIGETPHETELRRDRAEIDASGWWDSDTQAWSQMSEMTHGTLGEYTGVADYQLQRHREALDKYIAAGVPPGLALLRADIYMQRDPVVNFFNNLRTRERIILQRDNPGLTILLSKWGYNTASLKEYGLAQAQYGQGGYIDQSGITE